MAFKPIKPLLLLTLLLSGCSFLADTSLPSLDMPALWPTTKAVKIDPAKDAAQQARLVNWWQIYNDPVLTALLDEGLKNNSDLAIAATRIAQARARLGYADANQFPELDVQASAARAHNPTLAATGKSTANSFYLAAVLNYEIDLWGKLASADSSARAALLSNEYNREAVRISVLAEIAQAYFNLRALDEDVTITKNTIESRKEAFSFESAQYKHGVSDGLTYRQAESELASAQSELPQIQQQRDEQVTALAVLLGRSPKDIIEQDIARGASIKKIPSPPFAPTDTPSTILQNRPDIQAAEQQLRSANFDIGVARAAYFPTISLSGLLGLQTNDIGKMFDAPARSWQLGGSLLGPLIDMGRSDANVALAQGVRDEQIENYKSAVRHAFKDARDALTAQGNASDREKADVVQVNALSEALRLARLRYKAGYSNHLEVLDTERGLYAAQIDLVAAKLSRLNTSVNIYKAFGGGWSITAQPVIP